MRAIAVGLVILFHYTAAFAPDLDRAGGAWRIVAMGASVGWIGVDIFFVVSGYLIGKVLAARPVDSCGDYGRFLIRRFLRLVPAYAACLLVFGLVASLWYPDSKVLRNQYLLWTLSTNIESSFGDRNALGDETFSLVHFWSLALEWHFYILIPLLLSATRSATKAAQILILLAIVCRLSFVALGVSDNALFSFTFCRIDSLAAGVLLAAGQARFSPESSKWIGLCGMGLLTGLILALADAGWKFKLLPWLQTFGYTAIALSVAMVLLGLLNSDRTSVPLRFLESDGMTVVGRASYSIYIWHLVFFPLIVKAVRGSVGGIPHQYLAAAFAGLATTAVLGAVSYRWTEVAVLLRYSGDRK